jgi:hypothetical protein
MPNLKKRLISTILALVIALSVVACSSDNPPDTTAPGGPSTTDPAGS